MKRFIDFLEVNEENNPKLDEIMRIERKIRELNSQLETQPSKIKQIRELERKLKELKK